MSTFERWYPASTPAGSASVAEEQRVEPWALALALVPFVGLVFGAIAVAKGKPLTGILMMAVGISYVLMFQTFRFVSG